jgi:hypothetical protein
VKFVVVLYFSMIHYLMLACSFREMGDSSSSWNDNGNGYTGVEDSSSYMRFRTYEDVPPEEGHFGGHNKGQNDPGSSAYTKNTSELC